MPYAPEYNPIERVWAQFKLQFKKRRLQAILDGESPDYDKLVRKVMTEYPPEKIAHIVKGTSRIFEY